MRVWFESHPEVCRRMIKKGGCMFKDRFDAGKKLAEQLQQYKDNPNAVILAIPRGALEIGSVFQKNCICRLMLY